MSNQIFISYRRTGGDITAKLICEALKNKGYSVFYDYDSLKSGYFDDKILEAIDHCNDFVLVLPKRALARCKDKNDWVRQEIRHALKTKKNIIPIMLDGFTFPKKLTPDIEDVMRCNAIRFHMDFFDGVIDKIVERLSSTAPEKMTATHSIPSSPAKDISLTVWSPVNTNVYLNDKQHFVMKIDRNTGFDYRQNHLYARGTFQLIFVSKGFERTVSFDADALNGRLEYRLHAILSEKEILASYDRLDALDQIKEKATAYAFEQLATVGIAEDIFLLLEELKKLLSAPSRDRHTNYLIATCTRTLGTLALKFDRLKDVRILVDVYDIFEEKSSYGWMMEPIVKALHDNGF